MASRIRRWGKSLGVRIPKAIAEQVNLRDGTAIEFETNGGVLTIRLKRRRKYTLARLLAQARGPNTHGELHNDGPVGREII